MSELQISLLIIGLVIVVAVYVYNEWQQRQYLRKMGTVFKHRHQDALYHSAGNKPPEPLSENIAADLPSRLPDTHNASEPTIREPSTTSPLPVAAEDNVASGFQQKPAILDVCNQLDVSTDYIATITVKNPVSAEALSRLWKQRFDFGKGVYICGFNRASGTWEQALAESRLLFIEFKLALQLVTRAGPVSAGRLTDFRDLVRAMALTLQAQVTLPDVIEAADRARQLDKFCAEVDQLIGLNIFPVGDKKLSTREVQQAAVKHGLSLQADGYFHLFDEHAVSLCSLESIDKIPFQHDIFEPPWLEGVTLVMDLPRLAQPTQRFDQIAALAHQLADELQADVADDRRSALNDAGIALIRAQIAAIEAQMLAKGITPGSAQARRLFS